MADQIKRVSEVFPDHPVHQIAALRMIRIHPGLWVVPDDSGQEPYSRSQLLERRQSFNTTAVDIIVTIIRMLISFGYAFSADDTTLSAVERAIFELAWMDIGREESADWQAKRKIFDMLNNGVAMMDQEPWSITGLLQQKLPNLFANNRQFELVSNKFLNVESGVLQKYSTTSGTIQGLNTIKYDGTVPFGHSVSKIFNKLPKHPQYLSLRPKFLKVNCNFRPGSQTISQLRILAFSAPEAGSTPEKVVKYGIQRAVYHLIAVIQVQGDGEPDRVRTYWKTGTEIVPAEVGEYKKKENSKLDWSVEEGGEFVLFYFRLHRSNDLPDSEMDTNAPEFEARPWQNNEGLLSPGHLFQTSSPER
ncbi:hypothetical protein VTL71DRAFT_3036 [Oculimacula yallundae]|uniref:Uncharacterized protein n=1 Tax=Oculimacula yallundae TaxID=86028 RepID=A0ABR4C611_9HELO